MMEIVGTSEVANRLGVARESVSRWRKTNVLPTPDWQLACGPIWKLDTIQTWATETGRVVK